MLGAEGVHSTWATKVSLENRTLGRPETIARPRLLSVLQPLPRLIPRRDSPRSTEAPAQCRPRRWDPEASRSRPQQHRQQRAGRRPAPLQGPKRTGLQSQRFAPGAHPIPTLCPAPTLSVPTARRSPRCLLLGSQRPTVRPPTRSSASRATYRAKRPQPLELWTLAGLRAAPAAAESEIVSFPRPRRQRLELVPAASARAAQARLVH